MLGERLRHARQRCGLSQVGLGAKLNVSHATINRYEKGVRKPSPETLSRLADCLEVSADYLLGRGETADGWAAQPGEAAGLWRYIAALTPEQREALIKFAKELRSGKPG